MPISELLLPGAPPFPAFGKGGDFDFDAFLADHRQEPILSVRQSRQGQPEHPTLTSNMTTLG
jgi:hypothetical protein